MFKSKLKSGSLVAVIAMLLISFQALGNPSEKDIQRLNNALIFDLFINYELSDKNGNLTSIADFSPAPGSNNYKRVKVTSNIGGYDQSADFIYKDNGALESVAYIVRNRVYQYDFVYTGDKVTGIQLGGAPIAKVNYDQAGRLFSIFREREDRTFQYMFQYLDGESKAKIHLAVQQGNDRRFSTNETYVSWDATFKVASYCLGLFCGNFTQYTEQGDVLSFSFQGHDDASGLLKWEYSALDANKNWTERKLNEVWFNRTIEYR